MAINPNTPATQATPTKPKIPQSYRQSNANIYTPPGGVSIQPGPYKDVPDWMQQIQAGGGAWIASMQPRQVAPPPGGASIQPGQYKDAPGWMQQLQAGGGASIQPGTALQPPGRASIQPGQVAPAPGVPPPGGAQIQTPELWPGGPPFPPGFEEHPPGAPPPPQGPGWEELYETGQGLIPPWQAPEAIGGPEFGQAPDSDWQGRYGDIPDELKGLGSYAGELERLGKEDISGKDYAAQLRESMGRGEGGAQSVLERLAGGEFLGPEAEQKYGDVLEQQISEGYERQRGQLVESLEDLGTQRGAFHSGKLREIASEDLRDLAESEQREIGAMREKLGYTGIQRELQRQQQQIDAAEAWGSLDINQQQVVTQAASMLGGLDQQQQQNAISANQAFGALDLQQKQQTMDFMMKGYEVDVDKWFKSGTLELDKFREMVSQNLGISDQEMRNRGMDMTFLGEMMGYEIDRAKTDADIALITEMIRKTGIELNQNEKALFWNTLLGFLGGLSGG